MAIIMVVYAHAVVPGHHFTTGLGYFDLFIRACAVPLFIAVSGYLYCYSKAGLKPAGKFLSERAHRLLLPYVFLSSIAFVIKANLGSTANRHLDFSWNAYLHQLFYPWDNAIIFFWFIPTLMAICLISTYLDRWLIQKSPRALLPLLALLAVLSSCIGIDQAEYPIRFLNLCGVANYLFYFWAGYAMNRYEVPLMAVFRNKFGSGVCLACAITLPIALPNADYGFAFAEAAFGCLGLFVMAKSLFSFKAPSSLLFIGDSSYQIYLLSWFFQTMPIIIFSRYVSSEEYLVAATSISLGLLGPLLSTLLVRRRIYPMRSLIGLR